MTKYIYIKFADTPSSPKAKSKNRIRSKIFCTIFFFIPKSNPEYGDLIDDVAEWQLEIDLDNNYTHREIGKDVHGKTILIMPWRNEYGFWTDSDMTLDKFIGRFDAIEIEKSEFDNNWNEFVLKHQENSKM